MRAVCGVPLYGCRRACAWVNRQRVNTGAARVNAKRIYRVMAGNALLLPSAPRCRQSSRPHEGKVEVDHSDTLWCSDAFEIKCDSGQTATATFTKDCSDREMMAAACKHFNELHLHSALEMKSPREFRQHHASCTCRSSASVMPKRWARALAVS